MIPRRALAALLLPAPGLAAEPGTRRAEGGTLVQLAAEPAVSLSLRGAARGRQQSVYEGLRLPGPPVALVAERWLVGWGREGDRGLFLAFDWQAEQLFLLLLIDGEPVYLAPSRHARWPEGLAEPFGRFAPGLARPPVFAD
ncbi:hypothetical protein [Belnapia sp. F-4-1]|uniref:hypothetical protein n=1 Tax=Belnapia sp. F-4-1 TaxID=1545443 RepID=UPI0005BCBA49|nr:hypothetical protein [Belnapia sp. F-4-1]